MRNRTLYLIACVTGLSSKKEKEEVVVTTPATPDSKHVIMYRHDGNCNARVIQLPGSWFDS